jgi:hypothetical protein
MENKLLVILGCDCDPDRPLYGGVDHRARRLEQKWRGIEEGIVLLRERLEKIERRINIRPKVVFCLRSDFQMKEIYGEAAWPIQRYSDMWSRLADEGHELAWHPHLWRWSDDWECWYQDIQDAEWIRKCLKTGLSAYSEATASSPITCHMGWTFHNNLTMNLISEFGLKVDFSASSGVYYEGGPGNTGTVFDNMIDWRETPHGWYRPSESDYRRPARSGENELEIVEVPKFTSQSRLLKKAKRLASRSSEKSGSESGTSVFLQITALPILYERVIKERLACQEAEPFFVSYFHPDELLSDRPRSAKGFLYSLDNMERNLVKLVDAARAKGKDVEFATGDDVVEHVSATRKD